MPVIKAMVITLFNGLFAEGFALYFSSTSLYKAGLLSRIGWRPLGFAPASGLESRDEAFPRVRTTWQVFLLSSLQLPDRGESCLYFVGGLTLLGTIQSPDQSLLKPCMTPACLEHLARSAS